jgi:hypothetical protein
VGCSLQFLTGWIGVVTNKTFSTNQVNHSGIERLREDISVPFDRGKESSIHIWDLAGCSCSTSRSGVFGPLNGPPYASIQLGCFPFFCYCSLLSLVETETNDIFCKDENISIGCIHVDSYIVGRLCPGRATESPEPSPAPTTTKSPTSKPTVTASPSFPFPTPSPTKLRVHRSQLHPQILQNLPLFQRLLRLVQRNRHLSPPSRLNPQFLVVPPLVLPSLQNLLLPRRLQSLPRVNQHQGHQHQIYPSSISNPDRYISTKSCLH